MSQNGRRNFLVEMAGACLMGGCLSVSRNEDTLPVDNCEPSVRDELNALIARNRGNHDAYAVFDSDNTTAIGDILNECRWRMLETSALKCDFAAALKGGIPGRYHARVEEMAKLLPGLKAMDETARTAL